MLACLWDLLFCRSFACGNLLYVFLQKLNKGSTSLLMKERIDHACECKLTVNFVFGTNYKDFGASMMLMCILHTYAH